MKLTSLIPFLLLAPTITHAQAIPPTLTGTWRITKILPTRNIQCWSADRAKTLLGTTLRYAPYRLTSLAGKTPVSQALTRTLSLSKFQVDYNVNLSDLGIVTPDVNEIALQHKDSAFTGATTRVPGDTVLLVSPTHIVISACGVFYSAIKVGSG
jgi:hypothetical protein